jgi:hypothetical protein
MRLQKPSKRVQSCTNGESHAGPQYFWIERYEISIGEKDVHPLHTRYNVGVNSGSIPGKSGPFRAPLIKRLKA